MKTDKQVYRIFEAVPDWVFQLAGLPSPGRCVLRSVTIKALERNADGVIVPEAPDQPLTVIEFQFQKDATIYTRIVAEMVAVQEATQMRPVQGVVFFGYNNLDPRTMPWTRVVQTLLLRDAVEAFEQSHPKHPLAAVFKPLLADSEEILEREAVTHYRTIKYSELVAASRTNLLEVFISWLEQRLSHKSKKEIEIMLLGELPELEETQSGRDLIRIGEERGLHKAILVSLRARYGTVPATVQHRIQSLNIDEAERVLEYLPHCPALDALTQWLASVQQ
jgi:hypothetical protein